MHEEYGGSSVPVPLDPERAALAEQRGRRGGRRFGRAPAYARVDVMRWEDAWVVSELELIEPGLYLDVDPTPAEPFAELLASLLWSDPSETLDKGRAPGSCGNAPTSDPRSAGGSVSSTGRPAGRNQESTSDAMTRQPRTRPTLEEVAAAAGVGRGTASRVINGSRKVSDQARLAVEAAIAELGYVPNRAARTLVTQRTDAVALVIAESEERVFGDPFFAGVVRGIGTALSDARLQLVLLLADTAHRNGRLDDYLTRQHVDGVLLLSLHDDDELPERIRARGLPVVLGGRATEDQ